MKKTAQKSMLLEAEIPLLIFREGKQYVAHSPVLELASHGKTRAEAQKHFAAAAELFFEELIDMGTLDDVLMDLGWTKEKKTWQPPVEVKHMLCIPAPRKVPVA